MTLTWTGLTYFKLELRKQEFEDWVTKGFKIGVGKPTGTGIPPKSTTTTVVTSSKVATSASPTTTTEKSATTTVTSTTTTTTTKKATTTEKITTPIRSEEIDSTNVQEVVSSITDKPSDAPVIEPTNAGLTNQEPIKY